MPRAAGERGSITAEFAIVLPAVMVVLLLVIAAVLLSAQQLTLTAAAGDVARLEARGDTSAAQQRLLRLPHAVTVQRSSRAAVYCVSLTAHPGAGPLAAISLGASACAARIDGVGNPEADAE